MAWTAELVNKFPYNKQYAFVVRYTDGVDEVNEQINARTPEDARRKVYSRIAELEAKVDFDGMPLGPISAPAVSTPTAAEIQEQTFRDNDRKLSAALRAVDKGLLSANDSRITNIKSDMSAAIASKPALIFLIS